MKNIWNFDDFINESHAMTNKYTRLVTKLMSRLVKYFGTINIPTNKEAQEIQYDNGYLVEPEDTNKIHFNFISQQRREFLALWIPRNFNFQTSDIEDTVTQVETEINSQNPNDVKSFSINKYDEKIFKKFYLIIICDKNIEHLTVRFINQSINNAIRR